MPGISERRKIRYIKNDPLLRMIIHQERCGETREQHEENIAEFDPGIAGPHVEPHQQVDRGRHADQHDDSCEVSGQGLISQQKSQPEIQRNLQYEEEDVKEKGNHPFGNDLKPGGKSNFFARS